jgi:hypothetical protein
MVWEAWRGRMKAPIDRFNYSTTNELNDKLEFCSKTFTKIKEEDNNKKTFHSSMIRVVARAYII